MNANRGTGGSPVKPAVEQPSEQTHGRAAPTTTGREPSRRAFLRASAALAGALIASSRAHAQDAMPAIDVHAHMPLQRFGGPLAGRFANVAEDADADLRALAEAVQGDSLLAVGAARLRDMDAWGVAKSVIMPIDFGRSDADAFWAEHDAVLDVANQHPERFIPFLAIDPQRAEAIDWLDRAVAAGFRGVKIHPLAGFAVDDEAVFPFYQRCAEHGLPVLGHCRPVGVGERDNLSRPERYGRVAAAFPELKICLGHFGGEPWARDALAVVSEHENAYGDLSTMQGYQAAKPAEFAALMRDVMDSPARARIMYGSDWPTGRERDAAFLAALRAGLSDGNGEAALSEADVRLVLRDNAEAFLGM